MKYAPSQDRNGKELHPGDRVRFKLYPRGSGEGVVTISPRTQERLPDGSYAPALAIESEGTLFGMPPSKGVLKIGTMAERVTERHVGKKIARQLVASGSTWYHLTDRSKFKLDPKFAPADNAVAIEDRSGKPGIYLGQSVEKWVNGYGYWRPFVVEFKVDPSIANDPGVSGRYGGEMFVPATSFGKLKIERVIPIDAYAREEYQDFGWIESDLEVTFDTNEPIPRLGTPERNEAKKKLRGYHYPGPDVRVMPGAEVSRLKKQLKQVKH